MKWHEKGNRVHGLAYIIYSDSNKPIPFPTLKQNTISKSSDMSLRDIQVF